MMASMLSSSLLPLLVLVATCFCAPSPSRLAGGFNLGGKSDLSLAAGGSGVIHRDGYSLNGEGNGLVGARWTGTGYGGAYGALNDHYIGTSGVANGALGGNLRPGFKGAFGVDSKGNVPLGFQPSLGIGKEADLRANGEIVTGDDGKRLAKNIGDNNFGNFRPAGDLYNEVY